MADANSANPTPKAIPADPAKAGAAEPGPAPASAPPSGEGRRLSAVPGQKGPERPPAQPARSARSERKGVSRGVFALVVALLVLALVGLFVQTQHVAAQDERIATLAGQVEGLEFQLSAANTQIATYDMQRTLVRSSVSDLMTQVTSLAELVDADPMAPAAAPESPEATPEAP